jgi:hydroxylaminobenzene mutase
MNFHFNRYFLISGLLMLMCGLLVPIYSPYAIAQIGILQAHLIGAVQALVFFAFAWMWPQLTLPVFSKKIATISLYISLWANWLGTFVGIFGAGKEQYIVHQDLVPGATGFWNVITLMLINLSLLAVLATLLAIVGFLKYDFLVRRDKTINYTSLALFMACIGIALFQTFNPEYSNG